VHATLVHASLHAYQRFAATLNAQEEEDYYQEMATVARIFGTPAAVLPRTLAEFCDYFDAQVEEADICVTPPAREIASVIHDAPLPAPMRLLAPAHRLATTALLPAKLRDEYGLRWSPLHELALPVAARSLHVGAIPALRIAGRMAPPPRALAA
jgi:uncharacterized protein (DUF2236 family)